MKHEWKVGDKATVEATYSWPAYITEITKAGKRPTTADHNQWHARGDVWEKWGGYGDRRRMRPWRVGDEERIALAKLEKERDQAENLQESAQASARAFHEKAEKHGADAARLASEIAALKAKLAQMEQP